MRYPLRYPQTPTQERLRLIREAASAEGVEDYGPTLVVLVVGVIGWLGFALFLANLVLGR